MSQWIWLDPQFEEAYQLCRPCAMDREEGKKDACRYAVAEFRRSYAFDRPVESVSLRVSGDTVYRLYLNGALVGQGPVSAGGDFLCHRPMPRFFATRYELPVQGKNLEFFAQVRLSPVAMTEYSCGHGGLMAEAQVRFADGTVETLETDGSWQARRNERFVAPHVYDGTRFEGEWRPACPVPSVWNLADAPIPPLWEGDILPLKEAEVTVNPGETRAHTVLFDKIYAAYLLLDVSGACEIEAHIFELEGQSGDTLKARFAGAERFRSLSMYSTGGYALTIQNQSGAPLTVKVRARMCCYPVEMEGSFHSSDPMLDKVYEVCKWTLQICRQTLHLDSPKHQEPLACTGDYYIESLMTAFTFGDMRLAELDVRRTADWLNANDGRMFHTTYSLIWVMMLYDVYQYSGNRALLYECAPALDKLLSRFARYLGDNGLIENAPDYMFVDWLVTEGYSMHHPPKALGQSCLNAFYHGALKTAEKIYALLERPDQAQACARQADALRKAFNALLYDPEKGLYFDGLTTPQEEIKPYRPANVNLKHFSRHANVLSVLYGLCEGAQAETILRRALDSDTMQQVQPYFMHFVLDAVWKMGLFEEYGLKLLSMWKPLAAECDKGLKEGWFAPQEDYSFDHSHAWGGTPAYQLPARLLGFKMLKPGFEQIELSPRLYGLDWFKIIMPTPKGLLSVSLNKGEAPRISAPRGLNYTVK